ATGAAAASAQPGAFAAYPQAIATGAVNLEANAQALAVYAGLPGTTSGPGGRDYYVGPNVPANDRIACTGNGRGRLPNQTAIAVSGNAVVVAYNDSPG